MDTRSAVKWYEDFHERKPKRARVVRLKLPKTVAVMGYCDAIQYRMVNGGQLQRYKHTFARGSYPLLCTDGKRVYLIGGRYHVTDRGIVDLSPRGRERE